MTTNTGVIAEAGKANITAADVLTTRCSTTASSVLNFDSNGITVSSVITTPVAQNVMVVAELVAATLIEVVDVSKMLLYH